MTVNDDTANVSRVAPDVTVMRESHPPGRNPVNVVLLLTRLQSEEPDVSFLGKMLIAVFRWVGGSEAIIARMKALGAAADRHRQTLPAVRQVGICRHLGCEIMPDGKEKLRWPFIINQRRGGRGGWL